MMEVVVATGAVRRGKLQSNRHQQQTQHPTFYRPDILPVAQPWSLNGNNFTYGNGDEIMGIGWRWENQRKQSWDGTK